MSNLSTGTSMSVQRRVKGISTACWCGSSVVAKISKSDANPSRCCYRCATAASSKLQHDEHVFKWCDEAYEDDIVSLSNALGRLANNVRTMTAYMKDQEAVAREKVENELFLKVQELVGDAKWRMGAIGFGAVVVCLGCVGIMKLF